MKHYSIEEITTKDNLTFQGMYYEPKEKSDTALLWVHGLMGSFYGSYALYEKILDQTNIAFAAFNTRGHGIISSGKKKNPELPKGYEYRSCGAGREVFEECVLDIDAGITFLVKKGYKKIILAGHSTGANKVCYFAGTVRDPRVSGYILAAPMSDRLESEKNDSELPKKLTEMQKLIDAGKGDELVLGVEFFPITPRRFMSLFSDTSKEDVFDYDEKHGKLTAFSNITKPLLVVLSENDEHADRPVADIKSVFDDRATAPSYTSIIIPNATHGYDGMEQVFADTLSGWIDTL